MRMDLDNTIGCAFIGFSVSCLLLGVLSTQTLAYFQRYSYDRPLYKIIVISVWLLEILHSSLTGHTVYYYAISKYGNPTALLMPTWTVIIQVLVGAIISVIVKSAFAVRVWRFSHRNIIITGFIACLNIAILALAVIFTVKAFRITSFLQIEDLRWVTTAVLATSVGTDIIISASLTYYLHHLRNAFSADTLINGLIKYSIETGAVTSICGIATLVTFDAMPDTFVYMSFFFVLSKLYSNSLLATLNTRRSIRGKGTDRSHNGVGEFTIVRSAGPVQTTHSVFGQVDWAKQVPDIEVNVLREVVSEPSDAKGNTTSPAETTFSQYSGNSSPYASPLYAPAVDYGDIAVVDMVRSIRQPDRVMRGR